MFVNGNTYSFTSVTVNMDGVDQPRAFLAINYDGEQQPGNVQTNQVLLAGRTAGYGLGSGSFTLLKEQADDFNAQLTGNGALPLTGVDFDIVVSFSENNIDVRTDTLRKCRIQKVSNPHQAGSDALAVTYDLSIVEIILNGIPLFGDRNQ